MSGQTIISEPSVDISLESATGAPDGTGLPAPAIVRDEVAFFSNGGAPAGDSQFICSTFREEPIGFDDQFSFAWWNRQTSSAAAGTFPQLVQFRAPPGSPNGIHLVTNQTENQSIIVRQIDGAIIKQYLLPLGNMGIGYSAFQWSHNMITWDGPAELDDEGATLKWYIDGNDITSLLNFAAADNAGSHTNGGVVMSLGSAFVDFPTNPVLVNSTWLGYFYRMGLWNKTLNLADAVALHASNADTNKPWNASGWDDDYDADDAAACIHYWPLSDVNDRFADEGSARGILSRRVHEGSVTTYDDSHWEPIEDTSFPAPP